MDFDYTDNHTNDSTTEQKDSFSEYIFYKSYIYLKSETNDNTYTVVYSFNSTTYNIYNIIIINESHTLLALKMGHTLD